MKRVLIRPSQWNYDKLQNRMFDKGYCYQGLYKNAFCRWRELAKAQGIALDTWDMHPLESADVLWFLDLPAHRADVREARERAPHAVLVLQIFESPALGPHFFHPRNHRKFDVILTYDARRCDDKRYRSYRLPNTPSSPDTNPPFAGRRVCCMINTNRLEGYLTQRQLGLQGLPVVGKILGGWHLGLRGLLQPAHGELYSARRRLARAADLMDPPILDIYGPGWNGEPLSWFPWYPNAPYRSRVQGKLTAEKKRVVEQYRFGIAYENFEGDRGWIGEKIFDCLFAGTVPVYRGDADIHCHLPRNCMVHGLDFKNERELLLYLANCPESEWRAMREAGQQFLASGAFKPFSDEAFAERMMDVLKEVLGENIVARGG